jgi:hypothetical protein
VSFAGEHSGRGSWLLVVGSQRRTLTLWRVRWDSTLNRVLSSLEIDHAVSMVVVGRDD